MTLPDASDCDSVSSESTDDAKSGDSQRRDHLALVRTDLANERTLLAYGRTSLMVAATGATLVKFFPELAGVTKIGGTLGGLAVLVALTGIIRFVRLRRSLRAA